MYLVKTKRSPFYQLTYRKTDGKLSTISTKTKIKSMALQFLSEFRNKINVKPQQPVIKLKDFETEYISYLTPMISKNYLRSIKLSFKQLSNFTGDLNLNQIDYKLTEKFILSVFDKSKFAAGLYFRSMKAALNKAIEWNYISENPFSKFKFPKLPRSLPLFINYDELQLIIDKTKPKLFKDIFQTGYFTGLRLSEVINLRWNMIDFTRQIITLKNNESFTTKSKKERVIPINKTLFEILKKRYPKIIRIDKSDLVFSKVKGIMLNPDYVSKAFKESVRNAKLNDDIHFHTLRHSFASNLVQKGVSLYVVKELLGHKDITTTQIYSHIRSENLFDAVKCLDPELTEKKKTTKQNKSKGA